MDWNLIISILSLAISSLLTVGIFYVGAKAAKIDDLEKRLEDAAAKRIDEKFEAMNQRCAAHRESISSQISAVTQRLEDGDEHFDTVDERNQKIELQVMARVSELKTWMMETFVSKADLQTFLKAMRNNSQN